MDGIPSIRVHRGLDFSNANQMIRWTEVFIIKVNNLLLSIYGNEKKQYIPTNFFSLMTNLHMEEIQLIFQEYLSKLLEVHAKRWFHF